MSVSIESFSKNISVNSGNVCDHFVVTGGKRYKFNPTLVNELAFVRSVSLTDDQSVKDLLEIEVELNQCIYDCDSYLTQTLVTQTFASQVRTLEAFMVVAKKNATIENPPQLEMLASEWLLFARASAYATDSILGAGALVDGIDKHAKDILDSVHGSYINGVKCVVKENDVRCMQWDAPESNCFV